MTLQDHAMFQTLKAEIAELRARIEALEQKRPVGRPPAPEKRAA
jgi:cell division protein FtsB